MRETLFVIDREKLFVINRETLFVIDRETLFVIDRETLLDIDRETLYKSYMKIYFGPKKLSGDKFEILLQQWCVF